MCQGDLDPTILTPFEEIAADELTRPTCTAAGEAARIYANRVARLAFALHELLEEIKVGVVVGGLTKLRAAQARVVLEQESEAANRGGEVI